MPKKEEKRCGNCCWMAHITGADTGYCLKRDFGVENDEESIHCPHFVSNSEKRRHTAILIRHNRWRRDQNVPSIYQPQHPREIGKAIDFAIDYIKTFMKL